MTDCVLWLGQDPSFLLKIAGTRVDASNRSIVTGPLLFLSLLLLAGLKPEMLDVLLHEMQLSTCQGARQRDHQAPGKTCRSVGQVEKSNHSRFQLDLSTARVICCLEASKRVPPKSASKNIETSLGVNSQPRRRYRGKGSRRTAARFLRKFHRVRPPLIPPQVPPNAANGFGCLALPQEGYKELNRGVKLQEKTPKLHPSHAPD